MEISAEKTKLMTNSAHPITTKITVNGKELETVDHFKYLGAIISEDGSKAEILARAAQTTAALTKLKTIWKDQNISLRVKIKLLHALITSIFLYACESWTLTAELQRRLQAVEMRCLRRLLGISYSDHITNEEIRQAVTQQVKHYEDLLTTAKKRKLRWYGHVTRSDGLSKTILQGTVQGKRRRGGQRKKWVDNITEWTGMNFSSTQALAHNRHNWNQTVKRTSQRCPHDPEGSRDP